MKVSVNWIKEYIDFELPPIDELVTRIGAQLGAVEEVIDFGAKYQGIPVAKIVSCEKHPNADKLNICIIDDGGSAVDVERNENGHVQVVCGAPNVREGLLVAWIPPGAVVPSTYDTSDPFTLEARQLRGVVSNGMLASGKELGINDDHAGILEIDQKTEPGRSLAEIYGLDDYIIDIENKMFTHRPDCFGQLGVAREIAGILGHTFTSPDWYLRVRQDIFGENTGLDSKDKLPVLIVNDLPQLAPRFVAISIANVTIKPSPIKIQSLLSRVGAKPINNVVDVTNYIMLLTGQPLHAYDYDKVQALDYDRNLIQEKLEPEVEGGKKNRATLTVRHPKEGETIKLLNGKEIEPRSEAIMIASEKYLIGIGGVMGGNETEVDESTKNIILECATFDMYSIRRTSMTHGLFTDAVTRFNKGQSPLQNEYVAAQATAILLEIAGGRVASISDSMTEDMRTYKDAAARPVEVNADFVNARLGLDLSSEEMVGLLKNVEFTNELYEETVKFYAPFWRTDIEIPEDIVEEVGRLLGFDKLPLELPTQTIRPTQRNILLETKSKIRSALSRMGANEVLTYSFVRGDLLQKVGQNKELAFQLSNALSPDLQYYRLSLTPSLLEKIHPNIKAGYNEFALFEIGKSHATTHLDTEGLPTEFERLALVVAAADKSAEGKETAYYTAKKYLEFLLQELSIKEQISFVPINDDQQDSATAYYEPGRAATIRIGETILGRIGEYKASVRKALKLPHSTAGFELGIGPLLEYMQLQSSYVPLPRFPQTTQDITLKVATRVSHAELTSFVSNYLIQHKPENTYLEVSAKDIYQKKDEPDHKQVTYSVSIASYVKTMRDEEVSELLDALTKEADAQISAERI